MALPPCCSFAGIPLPWLSSLIEKLILYKSNLALQEENMDETEKLVKNVIKGIQDKKGSGIVVAALSHRDGSICKYFVICQGNSPQQVEAIAGSVGDHVREATGEKPVNCIGLDNAVWVAMDYVDVLVHIFVPETRQYYDLEHLWEDARLEKVPDII